jgi:hypothetical protein
MEMEMDKQLNFLDISTYRTQRDLQFGIYRKPTVTDIMIHNKSCHPREHMWSGIEYLINHLQKYPIAGKQDEQQEIKHLLTASGYSHDILEYRLQRQKWEKIEEEVLEKPTNKWVTFTYAGKEIRYVTKLFKNYNVDIAWHTNNSLEQHLSIKRQNGDQYDHCGIYKLRLECGGAYVGQTGRKFRTRYKEHMRDIRNNNEKTGYSHHIQSTGHAYGTLEDTLQIVKIHRKVYI